MLRVSERQVTSDDGTTAVVVTPHGDLDMASVAELHAALGRAIRTAEATSDTPSVVLDLSQADSLHPVVLGVLLDARRRCHAAHGQFRLSNLSADIRATLAATDVLPLFDTDRAESDISGR